MFLAYFCMIFCLQVMIAQSSRVFSAPRLDSLLQECAFKAVIISPKTGVVYKVKVPAALAGVEVAALRLRSGSLQRKGISTYRAFHIPVGLIEKPYVERVVLVYYNLANLSSLYYSLPGHILLTPVLGLLAYDGTDLSASDLSEFDIRASVDPILIKFDNVQSWPKGLSPKCVNFGLDGSIVFDKVVNGTTCLTTNQGHFSIMAESIDAPPPDAGGGADTSTSTGGGEKGRSKKMSVIVGCVVAGALLVFSLLAMVFCHVKKFRGRQKIESSVGRTNVPVALGTRTGPLLENRLVP